MARRIINKAYNDLVGGAGNEVTSRFGTPGGPDSKRTSVFKLPTSTRDLVESRTAHDRQPLVKDDKQASLGKHNGEKPEELRQNIEFVNIDGDGLPKETNTPKSETHPPTAYKTKSFMSSLNSGGRSRSSSLVNKSPAKPPVVRSKSNSRQDQDSSNNAKMLLPKGINQTNQPYVVPKFMPTYREMMKPLPKPKPLVSIVESTPPSMQKWAVEWNSEPKKTISVDELKGDLIREAGGNYYQRPNRKRPLLMDNAPDESYNVKSNQEKKEQLLKMSNYTQQRSVNRNHKNAIDVQGTDIKNDIALPPEPTGVTSEDEIASSLPWNNLDVPVSHEPEQDSISVTAQHKTGRPLLDWVPSKYTSQKKSPYNPKSNEYSFHEAVTNGAQEESSRSESKSDSNLFSPRITPYMDTEQQKFHEWFKERVSAAVKSTLDHQITKQGKNSNQREHSKKDSCGAFLTPRNSGKKNTLDGSNNCSRTTHQPNDEGSKTLISDDGEPRNLVTHNNIEQEMYSLTEPEPKIESSKKSYNNVCKTGQPEEKSSFYCWLRKRGYWENNQSGKTVDNKANLSNSNQCESPNPKYPWSVSYSTLHKKISAPHVIPTRPETSQVVSRNLRSSTSKFTPDRNSSKKAKKSYAQKFQTSSATRSQPSTRSGLRGSDQKTTRKYVNTSNKVAFNNVSNMSRTMKKTEQGHFTEDMFIEKPSLNHSWLKNGFINSEIDHVNSLRHLETTGHRPKGMNVKKLFPSLSGSQMKYWESKYVRNQRSFQNVSSIGDMGCSKRPSRSISVADESKKRNKGSVKLGDNIGKICDDQDFASIDESSNFPVGEIEKQRTCHKMMGVSKEFDVDEFLSAEDSEVMLAVQPRSESLAKGIADPTAVPQNPQDDVFVMALGDDPGTEDMDWSEVIGPKHSFDHDTDLTMLLGKEENKMSSVKNTSLP